MFPNATWLFAAFLSAASGANRQGELREVPAEVRPAGAGPLELGAGLELNRSLRLARSRDCDSAAILATIVGLGPQILPASLSALDECKLPGVDGTAIQVLSELQEKLILDALTQFDPDSTWQAIDASLAVPEGQLPSTTMRKAAVLAAGACASKHELERILAIAMLPTEKEIEPVLERAVRAAAERLYRRVPDGLTTLARGWRDLPAALRSTMVAAAGAAGDPRALDLLAQALDQPGDLQAIALAELARQRAPSEVPDGMFTALRSLLDPAKPMLCQSACNALGALGDFESVDVLIDLLEAPWVGVSTNAHRALCKMSGLQLPAQARSWRTWRSRESEWYLHREPALRTEIECGSLQQAKNSLQEISLHRFERHHLSDIAEAGLHRSEPAIRSLACTVLGQLASPRASAALRELSNSDDPADAAAARSALALVAGP